MAEKNGGKSGERDDVVREDLDDSVVAEEQAAETAKKLREKLRTCETERTEYLTGWQRAKADLINARKRDEEERREFVKFANERLIDGLLPVLESFELAMKNKEAWEKADKNWRIGVEYIRSQLLKTLADNGLNELEPAIGSPFDHSKHEAASYEPVADKKLDHAILEIAQKGYALNGRVLKPPKVKVGEYAQTP